MRPDEHKKKRSAQYNKKKAGRGGKVENKSADGKGAGRGESRATQNVGERQQQQRQSVIGASKQSLTGDSSSDDEQISCVTSRKTFKRREIVSNWSRYEVTETGNDVSATPAVDYSKLLSVTGGNAASHFRFKDEADWEETLSGCHGDGSQAASVLRIDCADLAASLQCLPLFERLGLSPDLFPKEQREQLTAEAEQYRQEYDMRSGPGWQPCQGGITPTGRSGGLQHVQHEGNEARGNQSAERNPSKPNKLSASLIHASTSTSATGQMNKPVEQQLKPPETAVSVPEVATVNKMSTVDTSSAINTSVNVQTRSKESGVVVVSAREEEELDFLLSMDTPAPSSETQSPTSSNVRVTSEVQCEQIPTQSADTEAHNKQPVSPALVHKSVKSDQNQVSEKEADTGNLEDWLDSILDD